MRSYIQDTVLKRLVSVHRYIIRDRADGPREIKVGTEDIQSKQKDSLTLWSQNVSRTGASSTSRCSSASHPSWTTSQLDDKWKLGLQVFLWVVSSCQQLLRVFREGLQQPPLEVLLRYFRNQELQQKVKYTVDQVSKRTGRGTLLLEDMLWYFIKAYIGWCKLKSKWSGSYLSLCHCLSVCKEGRLSYFRL